MDELFLFPPEEEPSPKKEEAPSPKKKAPAKKAARKQAKKSPRKSPATPNKALAEESAKEPFKESAEVAPAISVGPATPPPPPPKDLLEVLPESLHQARPVEVLARSLEKGRLPHGILLHGDELEDLEAVAKALAANLLETGQDVTKHPDFFPLRPARKARQIRIAGDQGRVEPNTMRWLLRQVQQTANVGYRKVAVIYEADRMNNTVANAFLKTLEEPPAGTTLILLTERPYQLLDTIRSRCFNFRLPPQTSAPSNPAWQDWQGDLAAWLQSLVTLQRSPQATALAVLTAYGLADRFTRLLASLAESQWEAQETRVEHLDDEERDALEAGLRRGVRSRLFGQIEEALRTTARPLISAGELRPGVLTASTSLLERSHGLLELNLREEAAIEAFFLGCLKAWTQG